MKTIFLDIDGVLNTSDTFITRHNMWKQTGKWISKYDEFRIKILSEIVYETDTKIVLSATMRDEFIEENDRVIAITTDSKELEMLFNKYGISIYDLTLILSGNRQIEIRKWLEEYSNIDSFVILDDDSSDLTNFVGKELVKTNLFCGGLSKIHKEDIINKLNNEELNMNLKLEKILLSDNIVKSINDNINYLLTIIPEIKDMINFPHNHPHHHLDVWNHTLLALSLSKKDFDIRVVLLLHDIGKPHSYQDGEVRHFKGHPKVSSYISRNVLERLGYEKDYIEEMCYLIENHDNPITRYDLLNNFKLTTKRYLIQYCDALAHNPKKLEKRKEYLKNTLEIIKEYKPNVEKNIKTKIKYNL